MISWQYASRLIGGVYKAIYSFTHSCIHPLKGTLFALSWTYRVNHSWTLMDCVEFSNSQCFEVWMVSAGL